MSPSEQEALLRKLEALIELVAAFDDLGATCVPLTRLIETLETP